MRVLMDAAAGPAYGDRVTTDELAHQVVEMRRRLREARRARKERQRALPPPIAPNRPAPP